MQAFFYAGNGLLLNFKKKLNCKFFIFFLICLQ